MKNKTLLLIEIFVAIYFSFLFINAAYAIVVSTSPAAGIFELLTIPAIIFQAITFLIAAYRLFITKQKEFSLILTFVLSIIVIVLMFVIK